jgi:hypothetical protein
MGNIMLSLNSDMSAMLQVRCSCDFTPSINAASSWYTVMATSLQTSTNN